MPAASAGQRLPGVRSDPGALLPARSGIRSRLEHLIRKLGTGFLFAVFGIGGLALATLVVPAMVLLLGSRRDRDLVTQRLIHRAFGWFVRLGIWLRLLGLAERGTERLRTGPGLVVANHPSLLDVVFLISRMPQADCIVKREAWRNPFLRPIVAAAGYIPNDDGESVVSACVERLRAGRSVILFPEGSRSPELGLRPFRRGVARIALESGSPITPVFVWCDPPALKKGQPWYALPNHRFDYTLAVGDPIRAHDLVDPGLPTPLAARRVTAYLRAYFEERITHGNAGA